MFTGIIQGQGVIERLTRQAGQCRLTIAPRFDFPDIVDGESIAVNGTCLSVEHHEGSVFSLYASRETMNRTTLGKLHEGSLVNLERALAVGDRLGGHIVSGHIDGTGRIESLEKEGNALLLKVAAEPAILRGIVEKGSVALDGISLTVAAVTEADFTVSLIPHTREVTNLRGKKAGSLLNIETDVIGKYVEKMMQGACKEPGGRAEPAKKALTRAFLLENGF